MSISTHVNPFEDTERLYRIEFPFEFPLSRNSSEVFYVAADSDQEMLENLMEYFDKHRPDAFMLDDEVAELNDAERADYIQDPSSGRYTKYMWPMVDDVQKMENIYLRTSTTTKSSNEDMLDFVDPTYGNLYTICEEAKDYALTDLVEEDGVYYLENYDKSIKMNLNIDNKELNNKLVNMLYEEVHKDSSTPHSSMRIYENEMKELLEINQEDVPGLRV